jgi:hypothetical protein
MSVSCVNCGQEWPRDPALEVPCPTCHAPIGVKCRRPSGHGCELHASRDQAAMDAGCLRPCPKGPSAQQAQVAGVQLSLF